MSGPFVVDASVGLAWAVHSQGDRETDRLSGEVAEGRELVVPGIWNLEVANALLLLLRRKRMNADQRQRAAEKLDALEREVDHLGSAMALDRISGVATKFDLTVYDAVYLELAMRRDLPLASRDAALNKAAKKCGVKTLL